MTRSPILFRVDGTPQSGWESLWRSLIYAAALQRRRRPTYFLSQLDPAALALNVKRVGNEWLLTEAPVGSPEDLADTVRQIRRLQPAAVIVDSPSAGEDYLRELRATGTVVVSVDHHAAMAFPSRLIINPLLAPSRESYTFARGTQILLGQRYALIRPEVRRVRPLRAQEPPPPFRALVALGDDDPNGQAIELAKVLANCPKVNRVDVAVRSHHPGLEALRELAAQNPDQLEVVTEPAETMARLARCHFALSAGNGWSLELASIGVPQFMIVQAESFWPTAQRLEEEGAAICLGWHANVSAGTIRQAVQNLLSDPQERQAMARCGRKLIDGRGPDRLVTALEVMLHNVRAVPMPAVAA
jgi:spore coat polysaccharide biosynthesis predicted glycosyltransferase SpsG